MSIKSIQNLYKSILLELNNTNDLLNESSLTPSKRNTKDTLCKNTELKITTEKNFM